MTTTVLVTGASGFVASRVIDVLLKRGYEVVGTVRSVSKGQAIVDRYPEHKDKLSIVGVEDVATSDLSEAVSGVNAILHVASPYTFNVKSNEDDLLKPAINGTRNVVNAALKAGIKRIVITSSFAAVNDMAPGGGGHWRDYTYTDNDWNETSYETAAKPDGLPGIAYAASKALAEKSAWQLAEQNQGKLELTTLCPPMVYGPGLQSLEKGSVNTSSNQLLALIDSPKEVPATRLPLFVDVRDLAEAHVLALECPQSIGKRIPLTGGALYFDEAIEYLRSERPELEQRLPPKTGEKFERESKTLAKYDTTVAKEVLGFEKWIEWKQCLLDSVDDLVKREKNEWA